MAEQQLVLWLDTNCLLWELGRSAVVEFLSALPSGLSCLSSEDCRLELVERQSVLLKEALQPLWELGQWAVAGYQGVVAEALLR